MQEEADFAAFVYKPIKQAQSVNKAFEVGATDYVTKPIHCAVLIQRFRRLIKESQIYRELLESQERTENLLLNLLP
ncbi:hypothetical protein [Microseira sp. BLCC-F43]|jgi:PleD family two-component response regulator|uniref:hypothetical protein n=1 Tax=Microseira sp. BLCC-F43 TaxID=3153602 RepID=UPI0035B84673